MQAMTGLGFNIEEAKDLVPYSRQVEDLESHSETIAHWNPRLPFDLALGLEEFSEICARYGETEERVNYYMSLPAFRKEMSLHCATIKETGFTFTAKARLIAEETLQSMFDLITDTGTDAKERIRAWMAVCKSAGFASDSGTASGLNAKADNIQIIINY